MAARGLLIGFVVVLLTGCGGPGEGTGDSAESSSPSVAAAPATVADSAPPPAEPAATPRAAARRRADFLIPFSSGFRLQGLDLWNEVTDPMIDALDGLTPAQARRRLNPRQFAVWAIFCVVVEIDDGGISEVYFNGGGDYANDAVALLRKVGAPRHADVLARANRVAWPQGKVPQSEEVRRRTAELVDERYAPLDTAWDAAEAGEGTIENTIARYIHDRPRSFFFPG